MSSQLKASTTIRFSPAGASLQLSTAQKTSSSKIGIRKAIIPYTFYNITSNNNTLVTSLGTVTITPGQWILSQLITEIATQLVAIDASFTFTQGTNTKLLTIARTGNFTYTTGVLFNQLGFPSSGSGAATYTGTGVPNVAISYIILANSVIVQDVNNYNNDFGVNNYWMMIPIDGNPSDVIVWEPPEILWTYIQEGRELSNSQMFVYDSNGYLLNMNNSNITLELVYL